MSIDWNTAPEGATHWEPTGPEFHEGWMKKEGDYWFYWVEGINKWFRGPSCGVSAEREATFEARPQEAWDGQGLPPVGVECEYRHMIWPEYRRCEIRYISDESLVAYDDAQEQFYRTRDMLFRPIRTPEQIAAEERSKECDRIFFILSNVGREGNRSDMAEALYDAGLRLTNKK
ncbi:hypothetical protein ACT03H_27590 [Pseudomonas aeruginosa]|uniref:hypothetical protein n=1 Tax=Pseudomonas aeruginosa TaxID=287 RepID=UPI00402B4AB3